MKIAGICFTKSGLALACRIQAGFQITSEGEPVNQEWVGKGRMFESEPAFSVAPLRESLHDWVEQCFSEVDCLIFISATGIAVRAIAPFVRDKRSDPAVLVLDEQGKFCISLLSGHIGGANELTEALASLLGSVPVITTATDVSQKFAVDVYAKKHQLTISSMTYAKEVSAALVGGEKVGFYTNFPVDGALPEGLVWSEQVVREQRQEDGSGQTSTTLGIYISPSYHRAYFDHTLWLIPRCLTIGIGCRKGAGAEQIARLVDETLRSCSLYPEAIASVATIDLKKDEPGLLAFCRERALPLITYSAEELAAVPGSFTASGFVSEITGVDNVCERSAILAGGGSLLTKKQKGDGVTCAVALQNWRVHFE